MNIFSSICKLVTNNKRYIVRPSIYVCLFGQNKKSKKSKFLSMYLVLKYKVPKAGQVIIISLFETATVLLVIIDCLLQD